jgi:bifunctional enzyme CysN/CysC
VTIDLDRAVPIVRYEQDRKLGGFILIDKVSHATVAGGLVQAVADNPKHAAECSDPAESIYWISGAARAEWAQRELARLKALGRPVSILDDEALAKLPAGEGCDRLRLAREVALLMSAAGVHVLVTVEAPAEEAWPGRRIDSGSGNREGAVEWVI